jgi:hypothetical protein
MQLELTKLWLARARLGTSKIALLFLKRVARAFISSCYTCLMLLDHTAYAVCAACAHSEGPAAWGNAILVKTFILLRWELYSTSRNNVTLDQRCGPIFLRQRARNGPQRGSNTSHAAHHPYVIYDNDVIIEIVRVSVRVRVGLGLGCLAEG